MGDILEQLANASLELAAYASYAEIVGGVSQNRKQIREWCDKVFDLNHQREKAEDEADALTAAHTEIERLTKALQFYADPDQYTSQLHKSGYAYTAAPILSDNGKVAARALDRSPSVEPGK